MTDEVNYQLSYVDVFVGDVMPQNLPYPGIVHRESIERDPGSLADLQPGLRCWYLEPEEDDD